MKIEIDGKQVELPEKLIRQIEKHIERLPDVETVFNAPIDPDYTVRVNVYESLCIIANYLNNGWSWHPEEDCFYIMYDGRANGYIVQKGSYLSMGCPVFRTKSDAEMAVRMCEKYGINLKRLFV